MHDLSSWVQVLAGVIGTVATALAVSHKTNRADYKALLKEKDSIISELTAERDEFRQYYHIERDRRLEAETEIETFKNKIFVLNTEINDLKAKISELSTKK